MSLNNTKNSLKIVIVGHVDHGKSSFIGRIFYDTNSLPDGKYEYIRATCEKRGMPFEWSFLMDALQSERDQGITIDSAQIVFRHEEKNYIIIDAPGHKEFLKNMISGAANAEGAVLVIDADEGVKEQSKRHAYMLSLLGMSQVLVVVNKMDLVDYSETRFEEVKSEIQKYLATLNVTPNHVIPISAYHGDNIISHSENMSWYKDDFVLSALKTFSPNPTGSELPLRFPVQDVYKFDNRRIIVGRIESGQLKVGDKITVSPSGTIAEIASIEEHGKNSDSVKSVITGQSVGITFKDQIFIERGHLISHNVNRPILTNHFDAKIFWLSSNNLEENKKYKIRIATSEYIGEVIQIRNVINTNDLSHNESLQVARNDVAEVVIRIKGIVAIDTFDKIPELGRFVMIDKFDICGGGVIQNSNIQNYRFDKEIKSENISQTEFSITKEYRAMHNGHNGGVLWMTGLSGAGKTTIAKSIEKELFHSGYQIYILDGDNLRTGLNSDLGFSQEDRSENIRRVAEVAKILADAGHIVICSLISPYAEDRRKARVIVQDNFHLIHIKASIEACQARDPKGLYKKVQTGEIKQFTGISDKYETPENADHVIYTETSSIEESTSELIHYVKDNFPITVTQDSDYMI